MSNEHFHSPCEKGFGHKSVHNVIGRLLIVIPFSAIFLVLKDASPEDVQNVRHVGIQSISFKTLLIVDENLNNGKN